jgi:hypothetical protein
MHFLDESVTLYSEEKPDINAHHLNAHYLVQDFFELDEDGANFLWSTCFRYS